MPSKTVFLDTNGWLALLNASDTMHTVALPLWTELLEQGTSVVVTDWVIAETGNGLARTLARHQFRRAVGVLRSSSRSRLLFISPDHLERAVALYDRRGDKTWGLVDCASFAIMEDLGLTDAFTNDRHFKQAGFTCLLPVS
jgi:uncharacterized protein